MDALLYVTVWISLALFVLAELTRDRTVRAWPRHVSAAGLALMIAHIIIAMGVRHDWQHSSAIAATAQQTREVFGLDWGGGVYVNYFFVIAWGVSLGSRIRGPFVAAARIFFLIVIANAAIVFAAGWRRGVGVVLLGLLLLAWRRRVSPSPAA